MLKVVASCINTQLRTSNHVEVYVEEYHKVTCKREAGYFFVAHPVVFSNKVTKSIADLVTSSLGPDVARGPL
jgi:hypothetical protein